MGKSVTQEDDFSDVCFGGSADFFDNWMMYVILYWVKSRTGAAFQRGYEYTRSGSPSE